MGVIQYMDDYKEDIQNDGSLKIAIGKSRKDTKWKNTEMSWGQLLSKFSRTHKTIETYDEYKKMSKAQQDDIKDIGGFVGGSLKGGRRKADAVIGRQLITLDADFAPSDLWETVSKTLTYACAVYSTHKHSPEQPRLRFIIPLQREVSPDEYQAIARRIAADLGIDYFDDTTYQPSRLMYWPSTSSDGVPFFKYMDKVWLDPEEVLARYTDWRDSSFWPESSRVQKARQKLADKQGDPCDKEGLIGAFCRAYTIQEAIDTFLPDEYTACDIPDRYTFTGGSTSAGLVIYDDKFAYSNHATDPASGKLCNAFDLVRIHKFGHMDDDTTLDTPITKYPSYIEMVNFIKKDTKTKIQIGEERVESAKSEFSEFEDDTDSSWMALLETNKQGGFESTINNIKLILTHDPNLKGKTGLNVFDSKISVLGDLPWRKIEDNNTWCDGDDSGLRHYLEHVYGITGIQKITDGLSIVQEMNKFHPIRDYLDALIWDGECRLDTLFVDYLGAEDSPYTRAVTRKMFVAAVARIYKPGTKFDTMLVLTGPQGLGKSTLLGKMGKEWYSDSFSTVQGKEAYEQLQGAWVIEMAELTATKKAEVEAVKHFISKKEDSYRQAYGRRVNTYKRQCVFFGTTNDHEFLRDRTGNRRFWPVSTGEGVALKDVFNDLDYEIDQLWAEAKYYYTQGEELFLSGELEKAALEKQEEHSEHNAKIGLVKDYVEMLLPENWNDLDIGARRAYLQGSEFGDSIQGSVPRDKVCALEIYVELFNGEIKNFSNLIAREINDVLNKLDEWEKYPKPIKFVKPYGVQRGFRRK